MQLLISDANILIDLEEGEVIEQLFQLPFNFSIPDILFEEELDEQLRSLRYSFSTGPGMPSKLCLDIKFVCKPEYS